VPRSSVTGLLLICLPGARKIRRWYKFDAGSDNNKDTSPGYSLAG
jgi:hypothetical protein